MVGLSLLTGCGAKSPEEVEKQEDAQTIQVNLWSTSLYEMCIRDSCMACICYCPKEAIEYGKKSKGKPRYHFEACLLYTSRCV